MLGKRKTCKTHSNPTFQDASFAYIYARTPERGVGQAHQAGGKGGSRLTPLLGKEGKSLSGIQFSSPKETTKIGTRAGETLQKGEITWVREILGTSDTSKRALIGIRESRVSRGMRTGVSKTSEHQGLTGAKERSR